MPGRLHQLWNQCFIAADEYATRVRAAFGRSAHSARASESLQIGDLEPRILFSATPVDAANTPGADEAPAMVVEVEATEEDAQLNNHQSALQQQAARLAELPQPAFRNTKQRNAAAMAARIRANLQDDVARMTGFARD